MMFQKLGLILNSYTVSCCNKQIKHNVCESSALKGFFANFIYSPWLSSGNNMLQRFCTKDNDDYTSKGS